jgi:glutamate-ammonia-ligase adenylyltransferase
MTLAKSLTRTPRAHDADRGQDALDLMPDLGPELRALVHGAAGSSPYLAGLIAKEHAWLAPALEAPDHSLQELIAQAAACPPDQVSAGLRQGKRRLALLTGLADLGGAWPLARVTGALSDFADAATGAALRAGLALQLRRGKIPGMSEADLEPACGISVLAMGKMGAHELNYSSDIDLIVLFDETRFDPSAFHDARSAFVKATRAMCASLSDLTAEGYVFRTDLRLRPDPAVTPVCMAMEAAERYYESLGRTWERAAYIKARPCAGDHMAGGAFLKTLTPFVWRRHLDYAAIQDAHDMRLAIREHKGLGGPISLIGHDMKLGRGGIREIEFFTQTRQLIAGGRDPDLRVRGTVQGLNALAAKGWVDAEVADKLTAHYEAHRTVEHRVQMVHDAQTHRLPRTPDEFERLANLMDQDLADLRAGLAHRLAEVHELTEGFFAPSKPRAVPTHEFDETVLDRWRSYPALRSARSAELFNRLKPDLLDRLTRATKPNEALLAFDGFLAGLPAGVQLFSLLEANPQLRDLLIDIVGTSPALAQHLSRNAQVFDAVIGGDFFSDWPGQAHLQQELDRLLTDLPDYETRLDRARLWCKEWHFRIGVHHLRGLSGGLQASEQYSDLARAVLVVLWPLVTAKFAERHGPPPGQGAAILGMGSLGAGRLNAGSDLDLIVIYDPLDQEASTGAKPLPTRLYYARLTQALITAISAPMAQGRLYEVDMRLRPSGNQGPVATSISAFEAYQENEAWMWEHLALTRAAVIAGPPDLATRIEGFRAKLLKRSRPLGAVAAEVIAMRNRIEAAKGPGSAWDTKLGAGRMQDIELLAQAGCLMTGEPSRDTLAGLQASVAAGLLDAADLRDVSTCYRLCAQIQLAARLLSDRALDVQSLGEAGQSFILRAAQETDMKTLETKLEQSVSKAATAIARALAPFDGSEAAHG